jgi:hypothetical protein
MDMRFPFLANQNISNNIFKVSCFVLLGKMLASSPWISPFFIYKSCSSLLILKNNIRRQFSQEASSNNFNISLFHDKRVKPGNLYSDAHPPSPLNKKQLSLIPWLSLFIYPSTVHSSSLSPTLFASSWKMLITHTSHWLNKTGPCWKKDLANHTSLTFGP